MWRLPEEAQRRDPEQYSHQRAVKVRPDLDTAGNKCCRYGGHREDQQQSQIRLVCTPVAPAAEACDQQVQCQRGRPHRFRSYRKQRHYCEVGRGSAMTHGWIKRGRDPHQDRDHPDRGCIHSANPFAGSLALVAARRIDANHPATECVA